MSSVRPCDLKTIRVGDRVLLETRPVIVGRYPATYGEVVVSKVGRRWFSVDGRDSIQFDRATGHNNTGGNYTTTPRVVTAEWLREEQRRDAAISTIKNALFTHGYWTGDALPVEALEGIAEVLLINGVNR